MIVVDASFAAKWVLDEPASPAAQAYLGKHAGQLIAPDFIAIEVGGAIVRRANMNQISGRDALFTLEAWNILLGSRIIRQSPTGSERLETAGRLAVELRHPLKDCIYLALAMELRSVLATCDEKFQAKAVALYPDIRLLANLVA